MSSNIGITFLSAQQTAEVALERNVYTTNFKLGMGEEFKEKHGFEVLIFALLFQEVFG